MPTQVWGEEWWKSNEYHDHTTSHIVAIAPPESQIEILQNLHVVVKENYMSSNCESAKAPIQARTCEPDAVLIEGFMLFLEKNSCWAHMIFLFFCIFCEGKSFETFKSHSSWVLPVSQLKPMATYALPIVGLAYNSHLQSLSGKAAIVQDVTTCSFFPAPLLWSHIKTNAVHSGLIPVLRFRVAARYDDTSCRCLSQSLRDRCSCRSRAGGTGSLSSAELPHSPRKTLIEHINSVSRY